MVCLNSDTDKRYLGEFALGKKVAIFVHHHPAAVIFKAPLVKGGPRSAKFLSQT